MAKKLYEEASVQAIADAIRAKNGSTAKYKIGEMANAILALFSVIEFDDRNDYVLNYLTASASYTAANRATVSVISQYASTSVQDQDCPKPFHGVYNLMPGVETTINNQQVIRKNVAPRMIKLENVWNVRDCGGYSADGGNVKYGMLFRGSRLNNATTTDLALLAEVGIKLDLDIRDSGNAGNGHIPNADYLNVPLTNAYAQMIQSEATAAANAVKTAMESIVANKPVYIHCASGADRTGCICAMLEAVLGMSDADIDRDFELTCFSDTENLTGHHRNGGSWTGFWAALPTNQGSAKMNVVKFLLDNGVTTELINAFRQEAIDGTPSDIDVQTKTVTNNLTGCTTSNNASSVVANSAYSATITPNSGYTLVTLTVTMGGVNITSSVVSGSTITIAAVTGNVVITALAEAQASYTNLARTSQEVGSSAIYNNGLGYKNGYYLDSGDGHESPNASNCMTGCIQYAIHTNAQPTDILYLKGYNGAADANHTRMCTRGSSKENKKVFNAFLSSNGIFDVETLGTGYYKLTPKTGVHHSYSYNVEYLQFSFNQPDGSGIIITKNEPIEPGSGTRSITNNLTGCTTSNSATSVAANEPYSATITPNSGYTLVTLTVTMGGVDITSTAVSGSTISIASVTGNVVITALAEAQASYTNLVRTSIDSDGSVYNGVGHLDGKYMSNGAPSSSADSNATITGYIEINSISTAGDVYRFKGVGEPTASHTRMAICNASFAKITETNSFLGSAILSFFTLTTETASDGTTVYVVTVNDAIRHHYSDAKYFRFSFDGTSGKDLVITCNEEI